MNNDYQYLLEQYFTPGHIVKSYGGLDRVVAFDWNGGNWNVKVQAVKKDGSIDARWAYLRCHATAPTREEMREARHHYETTIC